MRTNFLACAIIVGIGVVVVVGFSLILGLGVWVLWNWLAVSLLHWRVLTFWEAWGIAMVVNCLGALLRGGK